MRATRSRAAETTASAEATTLSSSRSVVPPTSIPHYQLPEALLAPPHLLLTEEIVNTREEEGQVNVEVNPTSQCLQVALLAEQQRVAELEARLARQTSQPIAKRRNTPYSRDDSNHPEASLVTASDRVHQSLARTYNHPGVSICCACIPMGSPRLPVGDRGLQ